MDPSLAPTAQLFGAGSKLYLDALEGLDREALLARPSDNANPMLWIAGHVAGARLGLVRILGRDGEFPWREQFNRGAEVSDPASLPEIQDIVAVFKTASDTLLARLDELSPEELSAESPRTFPIPDRTIRGSITFLAFHEGYHIGQMALLRKWLGHSSLVG